MSAKVAARGPQRIGRYEILGRLGRGGCGAVYKGRDTAGGGLVAIKVLKPEVAADDRLLQRFLQEFAATRTLTSPHIVRALEFGREGDAPYLVMEFVDGQDLWHYVTARGRLPEAEAVRIIVQVAEALHQAHEYAVIHRDVKPDNILLTQGGQAKLTDFGLVKDLDAELNLTETATVLGTPNFMAPEQFENPKGVDRRADVYALAATLYMAVTGEVPFGTGGFLTTMEKKLNGELEPPLGLVPGLSRRVEAAILRAMHVNPAERTPSCLDFIKELSGQGEAAEAAPAPAPRPAPRREPPPSDDRRAATRFACGVDGTCRALGGERRTRWKAHITDVSALGVGLQVARRFEPGTVLLMELGASGPAAPRRLVMRVVRVRDQLGRSWAVGCQLASPLKPAEIQGLKGNPGGGQPAAYWLQGAPRGGRPRPGRAGAGH
jgi:hypothetical protein